MSEVMSLSDEELVILNNILVKEIISLKAKLDEVEDSGTLKIGNKSLKGLIEMYQSYQEEIGKRGIEELKSTV
ncbi:hypothetical protein F0225_04835 [Vibrio pectenicida]|uniref:Uncharacterized protein n=1 Tax=Vibrio pectenicida TaxID=62763 RepID=A0A7Y4ECI6_9VIBR|nr:hypothetical protein [Vibrio pectenicida]NOH70670.1 hypothetical protein [Vibrio pectenicida]